MAVERLTDYTRRIWTALGPDDPAGHDIHVNDVIYYMDSSECCIVRNVYPDGSIDCETLPDIGGGGGGFEIRNVTFKNSIGTNTGVIGLVPVPQLSNAIAFATAISGFQADTERTGTLAIQNNRLVISNGATAWNGLKFRIGSTVLTAEYALLSSYRTYSILLPDDYEETDVIEIYK